jgi:hypothetical protein
MLAILMLYTSVAFAQSNAKASCSIEVDTLTNTEVFRMVDKMPEVEGGMLGLYKEISKKIKYSHLDEYPMDTKVIVAFVIDKNGQVTGKRIIKNIKGTDLGEQLLDIVDDLKWQPGICNGKPVPTMQLVPMSVDLDR